jgi:hypothetical protein
MYWSKPIVILNINYISVSTLTHYNVPSLKQQNNASKILSETVIPVENCEDKENVLEETKESTHAEDNVACGMVSYSHYLSLSC